MNKRKKSQDSRAQQSKFGYVVLALGGALILAAIAFIALREPPALDQVATARNPVQILDPALFTGKARQAYEVARDMPGLLEQLPCFCGCMQYSGHNSNLDCFTDSHGVG